MAASTPLLLTALRMKCPYCKEGTLFEHPNPYHLAKMTDMFPECPRCHASFNPEPGFYFGAAVISYILSGFTALPVFALLYLVYDFSAGLSVLVLITVLVVLTPLYFRLSRSAWLSIYKALN